MPSNIGNVIVKGGDLHPEQFQRLILGDKSLNFSNTYLNVSLYINYLLKES